MKTNRMLIIAAAAFSLTASAQVKLNDKNADAYNVGYGVEISDFLSTASATTITGEELQQTSATNLAQALYGRLPGLTALSNGGFSGDENKGASFNIRGYHTLNDKSILILVDGYERPIDRLSIVLPCKLHGSAEAALELHKVILEVIKIHLLALNLRKLLSVNERI